METDPNYEFEAPKWFDFTEDFEDELNVDNSSPIDSWFEKVHPLHEPKDPLHHDGTTKPLLTTAQVNKAASSSSLKPQTNKPKKNYNSKKSLGIKSIRTRRGQHENASNRQSSGKGLKNGPSQKADRQVYLNDGKKDVSNMEEGRVTPDGIKHNNECSFTPPWSNSSINKTGETSHENDKREGRGSSLNNSAVFSPQRVPACRSPLSPARIRSLKSSCKSPASSPKNSLLSKAVSGTCQQASQCGRKRRLLPAIPDPKNNPVVASRISSSPGQLPSQDETDTCTSTMNDQIYSKEVGCGVSNKPLRATDTQGIETQEQHSNETLKREDENIMFSQRPLEAIHENFNSNGKPNQGFVHVHVPTEVETQKTLKSETEAVTNCTSLEALLKQHNKKIAASRGQYDENGRKIRTAEPNFCPAPSHKSSSSTLPSSSACKRSTTSSEKPTIAAKQKRRSCVAAVNNIQSEISESKTHLISSNTNIKKGKEATNKQTAKQKRRSCVAALHHSGEVNNTEKELRDLIAQHNSRVNAKRS